MKESTAKRRERRLIDRLASKIMGDTGFSFRAVSAVADKLQVDHSDLFEKLLRGLRARIDETILDAVNARIEELTDHWVKELEREYARKFKAARKRMEKRTGRRKR